MSWEPKLHLFEGYGVEMEYMIVDAHTLEVKPITDQVIFDQVGAYVSDVEFDKIAWSNELVLHVIELKTNGPAKDLTNLPALFQEHVNKINHLLQRHGARLLPTGMHPFMDPFTQTKLWPHEYNAVYEAYNRIFDCRGHGWSNLQSTHLNLPFATDEEFGRLHAAIRLLLPIIPGLSASSPIKDNQITGYNDSRLEVYRQNQARIPSIAGMVIPEAVFTPAEYEQQILQPIYHDIKPYDPDGILQEEFLNSRGAIARFERQAIEIRIIDNQECPLADLAILQLVVAVLKYLIAEKGAPYANQVKWQAQNLASIFLAVVQQGQKAVIEDEAYLKVFNFPGFTCTIPELWLFLLNEVRDSIPAEFEPALQVILNEGTLSERIVQALGKNSTLADIKQVYHKLADCLAQGRMFRI